MAQSIPPEDLAHAINSALAEYSKLVDSDMEELTETVGKNAAKKVKANARSAGFGGTGAYVKSITSRKLTEGAHRYARIVYSKRPHYRLTHLLEFGHAKVNGGRTRAFPHWTQAEREAVETFEKRLKEKLQK